MCIAKKAASNRPRLLDILRHFQFRIIPPQLQINTAPINPAADDHHGAAATGMLKEGADLKSVSQLLGHTRTDTTTRHYQHTDTAMHREAVNRLPEI